MLRVEFICLELELEEAAGYQIHDAPVGNITRIDNVWMDLISLSSLKRLSSLNPGQG